MQFIDIGLEDLFRTRIGTINNRADFLVDVMRGFIGDGLVLGNGMSEKHFTLVFTVSQRAKLIGQTPLGYHIARQFRAAHDVVGSAGGHLVRTKDQLLGDTPAKQAANLAFQELLAVAVAVCFRQEHGDAQCTSTRNDTDLVDRIVRRHGTANDGMPCLVIGSELLLVLAHHHGATFRAHHDLVLGLFQVFHVDRALVAARGKQCRLVDEVGKVGTGETRGTACNDTGLGIISHRYLAHMHLQYLFATTDIGQRHDHLAIKTTGA